MKNKRLISLTACLALTIIFSRCVLSFAEDMPEAQQHFEKANELYKLADYDAAIGEYSKVLNLSPNSTIARNAQYWIGHSYFEARQFDTALSAFQKLLDEHPASTIIPSTKQMIERIQQAMKNRALFEAVGKANVEQVKLLIAEGADVNAKRGDIQITEEMKVDCGPLCYAVYSRNIDLVKLLVEADADVNAGGWPPLCWCITKEKTDTVIAEYLIDHGANVNAPKDWGPLQHTVQNSNSSEMAKLLIARGADINSEIYPVLNSSINRGRKDLAELLIQRGADVNAKDKWGGTPLYYAIGKGNLDSLNILIANGVEVNTKNPPWGETALHFAIRRGKTEAAKLLLEAGANISAKDDTGLTALHRAAQSAEGDIVKLLLDKGAKIDAKDDESGSTALHHAARFGNKDVAEMLIAKGARISAKDDESRFTALHHAARFGNKDVVEMLIAKGARINAKDKQGHTPLYVAVNHDHKVAEFLMNKGADSGIRTESGRTLLYLAQQRKQVESTVPDLIFDGDPNSWFGVIPVCGDVDGDGYDDILIGAMKYNNYRGRVYLFYGGPDMDTTPDLIFEGQNEGDRFGGIKCGDIDNDGYEDIVIAAGGYSEKRGRAYLYWGCDRHSMDANPDKIFVGEEEKGSQFGGGAVYDIDNDGYDDVIMGAHSWGGGTGRAYLYYGNTKKLMDTSHDQIFTGENPRGNFGYTINCGDVDNDGFGDIAIGPFHGQTRVYLYYGDSKSNMNAKADAIFEVNYEGTDCLGIVCVDQNRDGYDDVVIGARRYNNRQGRAYLFHGNSKKSMDTDPDMILEGEVEGSYYGDTAVCGDIDGDNLDDLIIGARDFRQGVGRVYVYGGKELASPDPEPIRVLTGEYPHDNFGLGLTCGDVNNDGVDDLVVGAYRHKAGAGQGRVYLYYGGPRKK